jgi:hypothetical protein
VTTSILRVSEWEKRLPSFGKKTEISGALPSGNPQKVLPLSGKALIERAKGLFSIEEVDELERHINESCEQLND